MYQVPSLPTESLYKFLAIGSIVTIITSTLLLITESRNLLTENIRLDADIKIYERHILLSKSWLKTSERSRVNNKKTYEEHMARADKEEKQGKRTIYVPWLQSEMPIKAFKDDIRKQYDDITMSFINITAREGGKINNEYYKESVMIERQTDLVNSNTYFLWVIIAFWMVVCGVSFYFGKYGFAKWSDSQVMTDRLLELQISKLQKETVSLEATPAPASAAPDSPE